MSQSREDSVRIQEQIILPVVLVELPADEYLMWRNGNSRSQNTWSYGGSRVQRT